jgi:predicted MFS family arabinose efflux permease
MHFRRPRPLGPAFWRLWGAVVTSSLGTGILLVVFPLLSLRFTQRPLEVSAVVAASQVPGLLFALPLGAMADRVNRRRFLLVVQILRVLVLIAFGIAALTGHYGLPAIYLTAFVLGAFAIAFDIAVNASIPSLVHEENLVRANAHLLNAEFTSENLLGRALGGAALAVSTALPFLAEASCLIASAPFIHQAVPDVQPEKRKSSAQSDLREGIMWLVRHRLLRRQLLLIAAVALGQGMVFGILALYARKDLGLSNTAYGLLLAIATIGTVLGAAAATRLNRVLGSTAAIVAASALVAGSYVLLAFTRMRGMAAVALIAGEAGVIIASIGSRSLRQSLVPAELQGRIASIGSIALMTCVPAGALLGGIIAGAGSIRAAFLWAAAIDFLGVVLLGPRMIHQDPVESYEIGHAPRAVVRQEAPT